ncbi:DNA polymerase III subunit delta [Mycoplasma anserisalpingitidis]|uniref:DNA polymerase III subunit delta n=1 Tax=Mycoplasma anserisalpingitidis TaxID=519450 RepID=UPI0011B0F7B1|nr:hypothetical protein [Mycoplasma anserisalpingitidis]QDY87342.1 hypothetical protein FOY45_00115 [Mycoplasma anserisalpingitidis]UCU26966.1 hypothetical protein K7D06_01390 [Mycoplasma anserisalpingitidis]UCU27093.1 hypothetical protein K9O38_02060 [Mycoplasma anserisalpingitidis]
MIYCIFGDEPYFIENELNKLKKKFTDSNIYRWDNDNSFEELCEILSSLSLFEQNRLVIIEDFEGLISKKITDEKLHLIADLLNSNQNDQIIFVTNDSKLAKNVLTNKILNEAKIIESKKISKKDLPASIFNYIKQKGGTISQADAVVLSEILPDNLSIIISEIDKLLNENKNITSEMFNSSIPKYNLNNIFGFSNSLESYNFSEIWKNYKQQIDEGVEHYTLLMQINSIFSLAHKVYRLKKMDFTTMQMSGYLKIHEFRIKKANSLFNKYGYKKTLKIIKEVAKLEERVIYKGAEIEKEFETFLIKQFSKID